MRNRNSKNVWMLPDGIEEVSPKAARKAEALRRALLDHYQLSGYDLVIPPIVEFADSLLSGAGSDLDIKTFKMTDRLSGRTLGVRADITPQITRMDAHSLKSEGPSRFCYAGTVLRTASDNPLESRAPIQVGVELYGEPTVQADIEVLCLMLDSLVLSGVKGITLDLGHVAIVESLIAESELDEAHQLELKSLLSSKMRRDLERWLAENISDQQLVKKFTDLASMSGDRSALARAEQAYADSSEIIAALQQLAACAAVVAENYPEVNLYFDLAESPGYDYHTGLVFAAFVPECGRMIANGGRYDSIGASFGRARPATGFNADLKTLIQLGPDLTDARAGVLARYTTQVSSDGTTQSSELKRLRSSGERVIMLYSGDSEGQQLDCDRELVLENGQWQIRQLN